MVQVMLQMDAQVTFTHVLHVFLSWWILLTVFLVLMGIMVYCYTKGLSDERSSRDEDNGYE